MSETHTNGNGAGPAGNSIHAGGDALSVLQMDDVRIDPVIALRLPPTLALRREVLPFIQWQGRVHVACSDERDPATLAAVQRHFESPIQPAKADQASLRRALQRIYGSLKAGSTPALGRLGTSPGQRPSAAADSDLDATSLGDEILCSAVLRQVSDIHLDPGPENIRLRFRVDGGLEDIQNFPMAIASGLTNRIKVLSGMDISEKRAPQDGRFRHTYGSDGRTIDIRAATLPTKWGERVTLRLLGLQTASLALERLGMTPEHMGRFEAALAQPHGMILLTGPTGSGKSTTLYAGIRKLLGMEALNIITLEDPVEYDITGVAQVAVDGGDKTTFNKALRSILRHDPDVVMIGEIRDGETASIAVKASLTGHLVFSSLHTNSAAGAITRLHDMGLERYLIASTLRLSIAQRLVRRLCQRCRTEVTLSQTEALALDRPQSVGMKAYEPRGCLYCGGRGYVGRLGLFEMLPLDESWAQMIAKGAEEPDILIEMARRKLPTLTDDALFKLENGTTSAEQVRTAVASW